MADARIHDSATVEDGAEVGDDTFVWHHAQIRAGARVGSGCVIGKGVYVGAGVSIGDNCKIQNYALVFEGAEVGAGVFIGPAAILANDRFPRAVNPDGSLKSADDWHLGHVAIADGASIGAGAILIPDLTIGRWALVGSGAVVTRDVPDHGLVAGNPARQIGWACSCGHKLEQAGGRWKCPECGRGYDL
ncbi:MAG TPA: acyltransferase [Actinomycetota bacterium]|nr:acyltransferase [Actinomycetota bacterium]